jgi:hypothetical protein
LQTSIGKIFFKKVGDFDVTVVTVVTLS